jgi:membrane associated rhomboid family serine protease
MIPIRDTLRTRRVPFVNYALVALCALAFLYELRAGADIDAFVNEHALVPSRFVALVGRHGVFDLALYAPFVSSMFLHAGFAHFAGNMLFLWIFGDNVEDRLGHVGYAFFYLSGGVVAGLAHVAASPSSVVPTVGASGAIAAVMGAYMLLFPGAYIQSLVILLFMVRVVSVPSIVWLGIWFVFQVIAGAQSSTMPGQGGVAWWAHAGGFAFGALLVLVLGLRGPRVPVGG